MDNKPFKKGDKVFDLRYGNGLVLTNNLKNAYSVEVRFEDGRTCCYIPNGKSYVDQTTAMLYHGHDLVVEVKEPVYEYQVLVTRKENNFMMLSDDFYRFPEEVYPEFGIYNRAQIEYSASLFEPSKRLRK